MSQIETPSAWCARLQQKMMAALEAAWDRVEASDDPAAIAKACDKARLCGQMAAAVRRIAAAVPPGKAARRMDALEQVELSAAALTAAAEASAALDPDARPGKPPAAQAVAMRAALRKLGRG